MYESIAEPPFSYRSSSNCEVPFFCRLCTEFSNYSLPYKAHTTTSVLKACTKCLPTSMIISLNSHFVFRGFEFLEGARANSSKMYSCALEMRLCKYRSNQWRKWHSISSFNLCARQEATFDFELPLLLNLNRAQKTMQNQVQCLHPACADLRLRVVILMFMNCLLFERTTPKLSAGSIHRWHQGLIVL